MSWSVDEIFKSILFLTRKNQSGSISPDDFFYAWNIEQNAYFLDLVGRWELRGNGKQGANTGLIRNETILSDLAPFTISTILTVVNSNEAPKPSDFMYTNSIRINGAEVNHIANTQISYVLKSVLDPPSISDETYYFTEYEDYYYLLPTTGLSSITLDYVAEPTDVKWGYVFAPNGRPVYNAGLSVNPKWKKSTVITITKRALTEMGITFKDSDFSNFGRVAQQTGD